MTAHVDQELRDRIAEIAKAEGRSQTKQAGVFVAMGLQAYLSSKKAVAKAREPVTTGPRHE